MKAGVRHPAYSANSRANRLFQPRAGRCPVMLRDALRFLLDPDTGPLTRVCSHDRRHVPPIDSNVGTSGSSVEPPDRAVSTAPPRHQGIGLPSVNDARQSTQCFTTTREPRTDGSDRDIENGGDFSVTHSLQPDEQDYRPLHPREFGDSALEIAQLEPPSLLRRAAQQRFAVAQPDRRSFSRGSPDVINVLVVKYRKQPRPQVRSLLPQMQFAEGPSQAVLDEIVCGDEVAC